MVLASDIASVSYTHLDVYKRQDLEDGEDVYNYDEYRDGNGDSEEEDIEFEDDDNDSIDTDSVMDRKQPRTAGDESEDVEEVERMGKK